MTADGDGGLAVEPCLGDSGRSACAQAEMAPAGVFRAPEPLHSRDLIPLRCHARLTAVNHALAEARRAQAERESADTYSVPGYVSRAGRGFVLIGALLTGLCLFLAAGTTRARAAGTPPMAAPIHTAFLGDSYTFGVGATEPTDGYAYLVSKAEAWTSRVVGLPGSVYVRVATRDDKNIAAGSTSRSRSRPTCRPLGFTSAAEPAIL